MTRHPNNNKRGLTARFYRSHDRTGTPVVVLPCKDPR